MKAAEHALINSYLDIKTAKLFKLKNQTNPIFPQSWYTC